MSEINENQFRTKTGICTVTPEQIILERSGVRGIAASLIFGSSIKRALAIYSVLAVVGIIIGIDSFFNGDYFGAFLFCGLSLFFGLTVWRSRQNSATPVIDRKAIHKIDVHPPREPITRGYFSVHFDDHGTLRQRLIELPGSLSNGTQEFERAARVMHQAGLLTEE